MMCKTRICFNLFVLIVLFVLLMYGCQKEMAIPEDYPIACYAAAYSKGVYKSENGGTSWFPLDMEQDKIQSYYKRLSLNPENADKLYVATAGAGLFSLDVKTGNLENIYALGDENITSLAFDNKNIFASIPGKGIYQGSGDSIEWRLLNNGLSYYDVNMLYSKHSDMYAGTIKELFKWDKHAKKWTAASEGIKNKNIIAFDSDKEGTFLLAGAGAYGGEKGRFEKIPCLYISHDQGKSWVESDTGIPDGTLVYTIVVNPEQSERIFLGTSDGVYRSTDKGDTWEKMEDGLPNNLKAFDIKIARMIDGVDVVYAAGSSGVYMTLDDDETKWVSKSYGLEKTAITSIILMPN